MDNPAPPRLRPGVHGAFDEESCRMHLHELGDEIVPSYPFAYGIQQIYAILLDEYGTSQIADAISVLHELLEDESCEGNIWRSWRHDWRHRNDNALDPFVPIVDGFVLPPPTSRRIRALRGANFSAAPGEVLPSRRLSPPAYDENRPSYISCHSLAQSVGQDAPSTTSPTAQCASVGEVRHHEEKLSITPSYQNLNRAVEGYLADRICNTQADVLPSEETRKSFPWNASHSNNAEPRRMEHKRVNEAGRTANIRSDDELDRDSQQEFADVTSNTGNSDDPDLLTFEMLTIGPHHLLSHRRTQSHPKGAVLLRPVHSVEPTTDIASKLRMPLQSPSEYHDYDEEEEEYLHKYAGSSSENQPSRVGLLPEEPAVSSKKHETPITASFCANEKATVEPSDGFESRPGSLIWHQETIEDRSEQLLPDRAYLAETSRMSLSAVKSYTVERTSPSISTVSDYVSLHSWRADDLNSLRAERRGTSIVHGEVLSLAPREPASPTPGRFLIEVSREEEISQVTSHRCRPGDHKGGVACSRISPERYPIDGHDECSPRSHPTAVLAGPDGTQSNQLIRRGRSILQRMPKLFRKGAQSKQTNRAARRPRGNTCSISGGLLRRKNSKALWCTKAWGNSSPNAGPNRTTPAYSFDGACDEDDDSSTMPALDLNKALPPQPLLTKQKTPASSRADTPSLTHSHESKTRPSTASTHSSDLSRGSSKRRFHRTTHELVHPKMAGSRDSSPLGQLDSDKFLVGSKFDPLASPRLPDTPLTFSSFNNANPFLDPYVELIPPMPVSALPDSKYPDPVKVSRCKGIPQSRSDGQIYSPNPLQGQYSKSRDNFTHSDGVSDHATMCMRGRAPSRDIPRAMEAPQNVNDSTAVNKSESRKRSRSPVKRFLGLGKSQSLKEMPQEKESNAEHDRKVGLRLWGDRLRHGFMTTTESKSNINSPQPEISRSRTPSKSTFPISIPPLQQARLYCEVELMICTTANRFLRSQYKAGFMSPESVSKVLAQWSQKNRPQVVEFQFDQATQRDLILYNINTFQFHGEARKNQMILNSTMYAWKVMAKEMSVRTFCTADSVIRKHLHDTHKVLELLGAGLNTFLALQELQVNALKTMAEEQKKRIQRQKQREAEKAASGGSVNAQTRKFTPPTPTSFTSAPMSVFLDEDILFEDPYEG